MKRRISRSYPTRAFHLGALLALACGGFERLTFGGANSLLPATESEANGVAAIANRLHGTALDASDRQFFASAPLDAIRRVLEAATRPLGGAGQTAGEVVSQRPEALAFRIGTEFLARLPPTDAQDRLLQMRSDPRCDLAHWRDLAHWLSVLEPVADLSAVPALLPALRAPLEIEREAARAAITSVRDRFLSTSRAEDAGNLLLAVVTEDPERPELLRSMQVVRGVYLRLGTEVLGSPAAPIAEQGPLALLAAEGDLVEAIVHFFSAWDDASDEKRSEGFRHTANVIDRGLSRLSGVGNGSRASSMVAMRLHLVRAITLLATQPPLSESAESPTLEAAIRQIRGGLLQAPRDPYYFLPDDAMYGEAGPFVWLDTLRRRGRPDVRHSFFRALIAAEREEHPEEDLDSETTLDDPHSFAMLWAAYACLVDGAPRRAIEISKEIEARLERAALWHDQRLVGECLVVRGTARLYDGDLKAARVDLEAAIRKLEELDLLERQSNYESKRELRARAVLGAPESARTLASTLASANHTLAKVLLLSGERERARATAHLAAKLEPFSDAIVALWLSLDPELANSDLAGKFLAQAPRRADALVDLARLAHARGATELSKELFATNLEWNALTPERRALEIRLAETDPLLDP